MSSRSNTSAVASKNEIFLTTTFGATRISKKPTRRSKFNPKRRQEVKAMRTRGACLRCRLLQIPCSQDDCCTKCKILTMVNHNQERKALWFSGCIRTRLLDASIFDLDIREELSAKEKDVAFDTITLGFASSVDWNLDSLANDVVQWLNNLSESQTSKVGILSSPTFLNIVNSCGFGDAGFGAAFQKVIYTETLIYTNGHGWSRSILTGLTLEDLKMIGALSGQKWLELLEKQLKPHILASRTKEQLQLLFLLVFGTILAVGYTGPFEFESLQYDAKPLERQYFTETQEYLCKILAHYMVFLATKLRLPIAEATERQIMIAAHTRWEKEGTFSWGSSDDELEEEDDGVFYDCNPPSDAEPAALLAVHQAQVLEEDFRCIADNLLIPQNTTVVDPSEIFQYVPAVEYTVFPNNYNWTSGSTTALLVPLDRLADNSL
ncbi:zn 2cys6 transcription factor protein [Rutstroemia sp. NJR-2017a BBW]|nr:zn 2cys6 transcription factor protein [Rutstroemia sp. NJR-2017a BBW]